MKTRKQPFSSPELKRLISAESCLTPEAEGSSWFSPFKAQDFKSALKLVDSEMSKHSGDPVLRLWWIRCQLEVLTVPVTALTAPLEEVLSAADGWSSHAPLAASTGIKLASLLFDKKQYRLAVTVLERCQVILGSMKESSAHEKTALRNALLSCLEQELENATKRREKPSYLAQIRKDIEELESQPTPPDVNSTTSAQSSEPLPIERTTTDYEAAQARSGLPWKTLLLSILLILLLSAGGAYSINRFLLSGTSLSKNDTPMQEEPPPVQLEITPSVENTVLPPARDSVPDTVDERLRKLEAQQNNTSSSEVDTAALNPANGADLADPEEDQLEALSRLPQSDGDIRPNVVPTYRQPASKQPQLEPVGNSERKVPVPPILPNDPARIDPKRAAESLVKSPGAKSRPSAAQGTPRGYEVEKFDPPRVYKTLTSTEVMSAPSFLATAVARLKPGTSVHVVRRMGLWLELVSSQGRRGYIFSQDAAHDKDIETR